MSDNKEKLSNLIKANINKARDILNDKIRAMSIIESTLSELSANLNNKIKFVTTKHTDGDNDLIHNVYVSNMKTNSSEQLFFYYFHQERIFPVMINYQNEITMRCDSLDELVDFFERLVSNEGFIIKLLLTSEYNDNENNDEEIPF